MSIQTMGMTKFSKSSAALLSSVCKDPPRFVSKVKNMDKVDRPEMEKSEWIKLEFLMDPDNAA
jgi:hypothetical protein